MKTTLTATSFFSGTFGENETPFASLYGETASGAKIKAMFWGRKAEVVAREIDNLVPEGVELRDVKLPIEVFGREKMGRPNPKKPGSTAQPYIDVDRFNILTGPAMELHRGRAEAMAVLREAEALSEGFNYDEAYVKLREFVARLAGADSTEDFDLAEVDVPAEGVMAEGTSKNADNASPETGPTEETAEEETSKEEVSDESAEAAPDEGGSEEETVEAASETAPEAEASEEAPVVEDCSPASDDSSEEPVSEDSSDLSEEPKQPEAPAPVARPGFRPGAGVARKPGGFAGAAPSTAKGANPAASSVSTKASAQARSVNGTTATRKLPEETPEAAAARDVGVDISAPKQSFGRRRSQMDDPLDAGSKSQEEAKSAPETSAPKTTAPIERPAAARPNPAPRPGLGGFGRRPGMKSVSSGGSPTP